MGWIYRLLCSSVLVLLLAVGQGYAQIIEQEDFGSGPYPGGALPAGQTTYNYNAPAQPANFPDILEDGDYVLATDSQQGFTSWGSIGDNTTGTGYMLLVNADDNQAGEFYRRRVSLTSNTAYDFITHIVNVNSQGDFDYCTNNEGGLILPNVTLQIEDLAGNILSSIDTGDIPFNAIPVWDEYKLGFTTDASTTAVDVVLINNSLGGCGNDLAIDDIIFRIAVTMEAFDDNVTITDTSTAQSGVLLLGANDTLNGNPLPGTELYYLVGGAALPPGITIDSNTGEVNLAAGTPEGEYIIEYEVCETSNRFNCDTATATINIDLPPLPITASDDAGMVDDASSGFTPVLNVLDNDSIDGVSPPTEFALSVASGSAVPDGVTFNTVTGAVGVLQGTPTGTYSFDYELCEEGDPTNCQTATVTIDVTNPDTGASFCPAGTAAVAGIYNVVSATGGQDPERSVGTPLPEGTTETGNSSAVTYFGPITMDLTGANGTIVPEGEVIEIVLSSAWNNDARGEILMSLDGVNYTSHGTTGNGGSVYGAWTSNILRYDDFTVPSGGARFLQVFQQNAGVRVDGVIYRNQCQTLPVTVTASDDSETLEVSENVQEAVLNVVTNDSFDGLTPSTFDLSINSGSTLPAELTFDTATGDIGIAAGTVPGTYSFDYDICESGTDNCDSATATIIITEPPATSLSANKSVTLFDPNNEGYYAVPGRDVIYTISIQNTGSGTADRDSLVLIDVMPSEISFLNDDIDGSTGPEQNPVSFADSGSGLTFDYAADVGYSSATVKPANFAGCDYTPLGAQYDPAVTYICFNPKGEMLPGSSWAVSFRAKIR